MLPNLMRRLLSALARIALATVLALAIMLVPAPPGTPEWVAFVQVPVVMFFLVIFIGKTLYDTFFYNHYWP
jgi:fumarate reductase subunit C